MSYKRIYPTNHDEWLALRGTGIGSSDVGTILGVNPFCTPYQLWLRKTGKLPPIEENAAMRMGHMLEPIVAELYQESTGNIIQKDTEGDWCAKSDKKDFLIASPDRICTAKDGTDVLLECKTTQKIMDKIPDYWLCQVQYLMYITEIDNGALAWLKDGREFGYQNLVRNDAFCEKMIEKVERFWVDCIKGNKAPAPISADDVLLMYPITEKGKIAQANEKIREEYDKLNAIQNEIATLTKEKDSIIERMKIATADAEKLMYGDKVLGSFRGGETKESTTFDLERFKAENPEIYAKYIQTSTTVSKRSFYAKYEK